MIKKLIVITAFITVVALIIPATSQTAIEHTYKFGKPGISEFTLNWTDNKNYSSDTTASEIYDDRDEYGDISETNYYIRIQNESKTNVTLFVKITWHPNIKRPSTATLKNYPYKLDTANMLSQSDVSVQGKKALMATFKEIKEYQGSESEPWITPAHHSVLYFLDDYTEIAIEGDTVDWTDQEFKSMLNSMKITPPDGYY